MAAEAATGNSNTKIFILNRSDLDDRIDPIYYNSVNDLTIVNNTNYPVLKLGEVVKMQRGRFGHRPRNDPQFFGGKYPFIQTGNVVEASKTNSKINYTQTLNELGLLTSRLFQPDTLVITIAANIGDTAILDYPACFPDSLVSLTPKNQNLNIYYLNYYFRFVKSYIENLAPQAAQKNINLQQLNPIPVVIPPIDVQLKIVENLNNAYANKQQKEAQARQLLRSIDTYILDTLGIVTSQQDIAIQNRIFTANFSDLVGDRFDPKLYEKTTKELKAAIANASFPTIELKNLITQSCAGEWGKDECEVDEINLKEFTKCLVIRATEFDNEGNLNLENSRVKYRLIPQIKLKKIDVQVNDLLIEKSGGSIDQPVGRIAIITNEYSKNNTLCYSNFIHKIRIDTNRVNPFYLFYFLKTVHNLKLTDAMQSQTNGIRNLIMGAYFNQQIPLPSQKIQKNIVERIDDLHRQINQLQSDAVSILANAKQEVERKIIG